MIVTVVGLGVIGGSFVKAFKGLGYEVYGIDTDFNTLKQAKEEGYIIEGYTDGKEIVSQSDLVMICLYPSLVLDFIKNNTFKKGAIVSDAVGIKSYFLQQALEIIDEVYENNNLGSSTIKVNPRLPDITPYRSGQMNSRYICNDTTLYIRQ